MRRSTAAAALLLALLALSCLAEGRRSLMKSQADKDAEALADQQAKQDALVADQAEREAELLRKQVEAQERKNRAAGAGGSGSSSDGSSSDGGKSSGGKRSSSSSQDSQGCTKPDYSGMSRKEKRAAKKAYEKCRKAGDSTSYDSAGDSSGDSSAVTTKSLQRGSKGGNGVPATYHFYSPAYETSSLYCADAFRGKEASLLGRPWTAYCAESILGPMSQDKCGRCIRVTNLATGDSIQATVVDKCGTGGMDLDPEAFNPIDTNGNGVRDGHMMVSVEWC